MKIVNLLVLISAIAISSCKQMEYVKNRPSKTAAEQLQDANFNSKEANKIIDYTSRKKKKRTKMECKQREKDQKYLETLNKSKPKAAKQTVPFGFY